MKHFIYHSIADRDLSIDTEDCREMKGDQKNITKGNNVALIKIRFFKSSFVH